jgi:hypothetical protein
MEKNVFSLKMIVIYLAIYLRNPSFPKTQKQQLSHSLKTQTSFLESGSMSEERAHAHMVYLPAELFMGLIKKMGKYEVGKSSAILDCINEALHAEGFIDDETYEKFKERYRRKLVEVVREREAPSIKVEDISAKFEIQKSTVEVKKRHTDYSTLTDDELLEYYRKAILSNDVVTPQFIQAEAQRRGYKFRADALGNVQIINLRRGISKNE